MKKYLLATLLLSTLLMAKESGYSIATSLVGMNMDYREYDDNNQILDSEKSAFSGIVGLELKLIYRENRGEDYIEAVIDLDFLGGKTDYIGSFINSSAGYGSVLSTSYNSIGDMAFIYTYHQSVSDDFELEYGFGLGERSWRRELSAAQVEIYSWYSLRPKVGMTYFINEDFSSSILLEYQYGLLPTIAISNPNVKLDLGSADIMQLTLPFAYSVTEDLKFLFEYQLQYQTIDKSNVKVVSSGGTLYNVWEPASRALNQYLKFGVEFKF